MKKKIVSISLSVMMVLSLVPQVSFAAEQDENMDVQPADQITETVESDEIQDQIIESEPEIDYAESEESAETEEISEPAEDVQEEEEVEAVSGGVITGFAELETTDYYYEGNPEEEDLTMNLPETLTVYIDGSDSTTDIPVSWEAVEDFEHTDFYFYSMKPVWGKEFSLSPELSNIMDVPWITVYKQEPENSNIEPMLTEDEIAPVYTEEEGPVDPENYEDSAVENTAEALKSIRSIFVEDVYAASREENTARIYLYLTKYMGLNTAAACGVMTNINAESAMSPINLQDCYNSSIGLSDSAYTSRVDSGKYSRFTSDHGGYGLCQWTAPGRKSNLLNFAKSKNKSIGDLWMQMQFFSRELKNNYSSVYTTLKNVPNNATGAYIAATEMCMCYEIPANTINTAASRGKTCLSNYWKTYSGKSASTSGTSFVSLCGYSYPTAIRNGKGMDVTGYAISNYKITSVYARIFDTKGKVIYSKTVYPGTTAAKLSSLDSAMKFSRLSNGTYTYRITAKDALGKSITSSHKFKVSSTGSTLKALGFNSIGGVAGTVTPAAATQTSTTVVKKPYSGIYPKLPSRGYFKKGDKGTQVKYLQKLLRWCGYTSVTTGGTYGEKTIAAVKKLQKKFGLKQDGQFGKKTLSKVKEMRR